MKITITKKKAILSVLLIILIATICLILIFGLILPRKREKDKKEEQKRQVQQYWDNKFEIYEQENAEYDDYEVEVAFIGDSLTDGCNLESYYPKYLTSNRGIGGDTTFNLQDRLQLSLYDLKPKVVVMLIGGNNLDTMLDNYESILTSIKANLPRTKIVLVSLTPMGGEWAKRNQLATYNNVVIEKLSQKYSCEFVDIFTPLFDETTGEINKLYTSDGVHFSNEGYLVVSSKIIPAIDKALSDFE
jgi:lysophospholipase L1-like esterase